MLKVRGVPPVCESQSGNALIPAGFGVGLPEVTDDVWLDFADTAYMKWVLALPDLAGSRVKIRVTPTGLQRAEDLTLVAQVKSWPDGKVMGKARRRPGLCLTPIRWEANTSSSRCRCPASSLGPTSSARSTSPM